MNSTPRPNILLLVSGSVAAVKTFSLVTELVTIGNVKVVLSTASIHFIKDLSTLADVCKSREVVSVSSKTYPPIIENTSVFTDDMEWSTFSSIGDPVLHIELRRWADIGILAPASANTIAKISSGISDTLITCVFRCWDLMSYNMNNTLRYPIIVAPAMNTLMWEHPFTLQQLNILKSLGMIIIDPVSKKLACGDVGMGALADISSIVGYIQCLLTEKT